jgi:hypothetical protein
MGLDKRVEAIGQSATMRYLRRWSRRKFVPQAVKFGAVRDVCLRSRNGVRWWTRALSRLDAFLKVPLSNSRPPTSTGLVK